VRIAVSLALALLLLGACTSAPPLDVALRVEPPRPTLRFGVDTFAFLNESRTRNRGKPDLYANWCFVMARAITQFQRFARFEPAEPRLSPEEYTERVRRVTSRAPWRDPLPRDERVVIPGYASLFELSRDQEAAVKAGMGGRFWTWIHWTNWRVAMPMPRAEQEAVARETIAELQAGRPVQWLVTNLPSFEMNHTVVVYEYRVNGAGTVEFTVYDPNDPARPGLVTFDVAERRFISTRLADTSVGPMRAFRMYYGPLL